NDAVTAGRMRSPRTSRSGSKRCCRRSLRAGRAFPFSIFFNHDFGMKGPFQKEKTWANTPDAGALESGQTCGLLHGCAFVLSDMPDGGGTPSAVGAGRA